MSTTPDFIEHLLEQLSNVGELRARKAFGEYLVYIDDKFVLTVCNNTVYVKMLDELKDILQTAETGRPYEGAKEHYILELDDLDFAQKVARIATDATPIPRPKKKKR